LTRLLEDNEQYYPHRDEDIEDLDSHIQIGIESNREAITLKRMHVFWREAASI
jgi:hypothetical protein